MQKPIINISDWNEKPWFSTGGTRSKVYIESPDGETYYFKTSLSKPNKDYKFEFWNEIIVWQLGNLLDLPVLKYEPAIKLNELGCISKNMLTENNSLVEGVRYLQGYDPEFNPKDRKQHYKYSFQLIEESLKKFNIEHFIKPIIQIMVFDALIGNGDRHQENWATINDTGFFITRTEPKTAKQGLLSSLMTGRKKGEGNLKIEKRPNLKSPKEFAPIYDNGSCLGRELLHDKVILMNNDLEIIERYIKKGNSEIHWQGKKVTHFDLLRQILKTSHAETVKDEIRKIQNKFKEIKIREIVSNVDNQVPLEFNSYIIPPERKNLIINIILLRYKILTELL